MTDEQYYNLKWKLPDLIYSYIKHGQLNRILNSMNITPDELCMILEGNIFPAKDQLKSFCEEFKLSYSTLKTWNVIHLENE